MKRFLRIFVIAMVAALMISGCAFTTEGKISRQLELGQKYLLEEDYEQAVIAFNKVIELDAKQIEAYEGLIDVYVAQDDYDAAVDTYLDGAQYLAELAEEEQDSYAQYRDQLEQLLLGTIDATDDLEQQIWMMELLVSLTSGDVNYQDRLNALYDEQTRIESRNSFLTNHQDALQYLLEECETGDDEMILELYDSVPYQSVAGDFPKQESSIALEQNGRTLVLVNGYECAVRGIYIYYGDVVDGVLCGEGAIYVNQDWQSSIYKGHWEDDLPNGEGTYIVTWSHGYNVETVTGSFANGLENGDMTRQYDLVSRTSSQTMTFHYTASNGIAPVIGTEDDIARQISIDVVAYSDEIGPTPTGNHFWSFTDRPGYLNFDIEQGIAPFYYGGWGYTNLNGFSYTLAGSQN